MLSRNNRKKPPVLAGDKKGSPLTFVAPFSDSLISPIELTKSHFLDAYSKGKWNLSDVTRPKCFEGLHFMEAPEAYNEASRARAAVKYLTLEQWDEKQVFKKIVSNIRKEFNVNGTTISIVAADKVVIKYESLLNVHHLAKSVSIDSHVILSNDHFLLLDASTDWRTMYNPLVTGIPWIKFFCGIPIFSKSKEIIGVLAIFDSYPKKDFSVESIAALKKFSKRISAVLETPVEDIPSKFKDLLIGSKPLTGGYNDKEQELHDLRQKLGRATSKGSLLTVFEKDGSGGPYSQNHNFKFLAKTSNEGMEETSNNQHLFAKLVKISSLKKAANLLCKIVSVNYNIKFVYVLELRIAESYHIESKYFPPENKVDSEKFRYAQKLIKDDGHNDDFMTRIIGSYGAASLSLNFENLLHQKSFETEFGIHYSNQKQNTTYNTGILMPFYRHNSKLVRQKRINPDSKREPEKIGVFLRSGGYLVGCFNEDISEEFNSELVSKIFSNFSLLRKIYMSG